MARGYGSKGWKLGEGLEDHPLARPSLPAAYRPRSNEDPGGGADKATTPRRRPGVLRRAMLRRRSRNRSQAAASRDSNGG